MPINFSVHAATIEDLDSVLRLNYELFEYEYNSGFSTTYDRNWTFSDKGKEYFRSILQDRDKRAWIAFNEQKIQVGYLAARYEDVSYRNPKRVGEIEMVYIDEDFRCSGIGRTLVEEFKNWAIENGCGILRVGALAANQHARDFYEKWGFAEAEIMYEQKV